MSFPTLASRTSLSSLVLVLLLTACAHVKPEGALQSKVPTDAADAASTEAANASTNASASAAANAALNVATATDALPEIDLSQKILYQLLMSEIAAQRGMQDAAFATELSLANETRDPRLARRATEFALSLGQATAALQAARLWMELSPASVEASNAALTILVASNRLDEAEPLMRRKLNSTDVPPLQSFAQIHGLLSRSPNHTATSALLQRLASDPTVVKIPEVHLMLAQSAQNAGEKAKAVEELQLAATLKPDWDLATILLAQYQVADAPTEAESTLTGYLTRHPKSLDVRLAYVRLLVNAMRNKDAELQFQRLQKEEIGNADALYGLGLLAYQAGNLDSSEIFFKRFLSLRKKPAPAKNQPQDDADGGDAPANIPAPNNAPSPNGAYLFLAQIAEDRKNDAQALDWLAQVQEGNEYVGAHIERARILTRMGRLDEGRKDLQELSVSSDRERSQLVIAESQLLREAKRTQEALAVLSQALLRSPDSPELLYDHAMAAVTLDKLDVMETSLRNLIRLRPSYPHGYNALGYTLADHNLRLQEARTLVEKALSLAPDDPSIIDSMGWVQYRLGNTAQAVEQLQRAYDLRPDADVAVHLGEALWASGRKVDAEKYWAAASRKEPDNESLRQTLLRFNVNLGAMTPIANP